MVRAKKKAAKRKPAKKKQARRKTAKAKNPVSTKKKPTQKRRSRGPIKQPRVGNRWKKGQTGNPKGRPSDAEMAKVRELAKQLIYPYREEIIWTLVDIMRNSNSEAAKIKAANSLADRIWGKAVQPIEPIIPEDTEMTWAAIAKSAKRR